ncbi:hypothetical protein ABZ618_23500 [Streptomyces roseolus]|uniref:hypothetical protein n=1 Tax=Streptomyces roseolus TaxID=67358 RepID=UPI0034090B63
MGIESDRMVFDYLSEVGDLAQQRHLPPGDRTALVAGLRDEIDRRRATRGEESPRAVRGILGDLGTPDEVVRRAASASAPTASTSTSASASAESASASAEPAPAEPEAPRTESRAAPDTWWSGSRKPSRKTPQGPSKAAGAPASPAPVPHPRPGDAGTPGWWAGGAAAGPDVPGFSGGAGAPDPDVPGFPGGGAGALDPGVPGFFGGIEAPELFRPPEPEAEGAEEERGEEAAPGSRVRRAAGWLLGRRRRPHEQAPDAAPEEEAAPARARGFARPFLLLAAVLLIAGAAFGWLIALALGWLLAYGSRRLSPGQVKTAVFVLPGLAAAGGVAWLWGRVEGRWGEAVATGGDGMGQALAETWPWTLRAAALASAAYLLLRARRP